MKKGDDPGVGLQAVIRLYLEKHQVRRPALSERTARRAAELDAVLELEPKDGIAENILSGAFDEIAGGRVDLITEGWIFDDPAAAEHNIRTIGAKWKAEEAGKEGKPE